MARLAPYNKCVFTAPSPGSFFPLSAIIPVEILVTIWQWFWIGIYMPCEWWQNLSDSADT